VRRGARGRPDTVADRRSDAPADAALAAARADGKRVLLDFGADWCPDCHVLAHYLETPEGRALLDEHFHLVSIDVGYWDRNLDVVADYGDAIWAGIPALVALGPDGTVAGKLDGGEVASASRMTQEQVLEQIASLAK
jgi:thiol:disulfide interchange protein